MKRPSATQFATGDDYAVSRPKSKDETATDPKYAFCPTYEEMSLRHFAKAAHLERIGDEAGAKAHRRIGEELSTTARMILRLKRGM